LTKGIVLFSLEEICLLFRRAGKNPIFHIVTTAIETGDAVSHDVLGMRNALRSAGFETRIYAEHFAPELGGSVLPLAKYPVGSKSNATDWLIYHHSTFSRAVEDIYLRTHHRKILKYHNITHPEY